MLTRQSVLRVAAASVSAVVISMGAVGPVYAAGNGGSGKAHASQASESSHQSHQSHQSHRRSAGHAQEGSGHAKGTEAEGTGSTAAESHRSSAAAASSQADDKPDSSSSSQGKGHQTATVCHLLGNGGYHLLTFDAHALKAHLAHGDVYPDSTGACPSAPTPSDTTSTESHGHTPVTVCHLLGNGGYHLLTFDAHALKAHLAHGDVYPTDGSCPAPGTTTGDLSTTTTTDSTEADPSLALAPRVLGSQSARAPRVLGVEAFRAGPSSSVSGAATSGTPAQIAPAAGLLPNTGAARIGLPLVAGLGLLAAGAGLLLRRRGGARG